MILICGTGRIFSSHSHRLVPLGCCKKNSIYWWCGGQYSLIAHSSGSRKSKFKWSPRTGEDSSMTPEMAPFHCSLQWRLRGSVLGLPTSLPERGLPLETYWALCSGSETVQQGYHKGTSWQVSSAETQWQKTQQPTRTHKTELTPHTSPHFLGFPSLLVRTLSQPAARGNQVV
jgi:hypothetical protein